jgi:hypothetical protein
VHASIPLDRFATSCDTLIDTVQIKREYAQIFFIVATEYTAFAGIGLGADPALGQGRAKGPGVKKQARTQSRGSAGGQAARSGDTLVSCH